MTVDRRIIAKALVLSIHMCSGKAPNSQTEKYNSELQENNANFTNHLLVTTTTLPVNPFVFSAEDYDILRDAETLQQALSIVAYEPQKIDAKNMENVSKIIETFEKTTRPFYVPTQIPNRKKYYEVPREQSNIQAYAKQEKESMKVGGSKLVKETSSPTSENPRQHESYHRRNYSQIQSPASGSITKNNQEVVSSLSSVPFYFSSTERTSTTPSQGTPNNYGVTLQYNNTNNINNNKIDQTVSETLKKEVDVSIINNKQRNTEPIQNKYYYRSINPSLMTATRDRIPRPFSLPTECNPVSQALIYPTRASPTRQNNLDYQTVYARQNLIPPAAPGEYSAAASVLSLRHHTRPTITAKPEQLPYSRNVTNRNRTSAYSRAPLNSEYGLPYLNVPLRRHSVYQNKTMQQPETRSIIPAELSISGTTVQEQPIAYSFTRRPEQITSRINSLSRQGQVNSRTTNLPKIERVQVHPTYPTRQKEVTTNFNVPAKQKSTLVYQTIPRSRKTTRYNLPKDETEVRSTTSVKQTLPYYNSVSKQRVIPEEQNLGHSTIVQPTYSSMKFETANQRGETKYNLSKEENNDDKDDSSNGSYSDSTENNSGTNDNDDDGRNSNNHYSYNYNERYEEPIDEEPRKRSRVYKTKEENTDQPEHDSQRIKSDANHYRGVQKKLDPDYDQDHTQYTDLQSSEQDSDYDQARGQNTQYEVSEVQDENHPTEHEADLIKEADHQHKKHHKPESQDEDEEHSEDDHDNHHHQHGEKGHKGYKQFHEHDEGEKGHHDKEGHDHHYDEKEGKNKKHHEDTGFHEEHEKGEKGEKKAAFKEKGDHKKGHSTKGEHVIHKKDEFEKKTEFFDEFHEGGDLDKDGGYHEEHHSKKGGHHKKGHHHETDHEKKHGEKGKFEKGHHHHEKKGHDEHEGHEQHHHHEEKHGKKGAHGDAKKWSNKKGDKR